MKKLLTLLFAGHFLVACGASSGSGITPLPDGAAAYSPLMAGTNVLPVYVGSFSYLNEPLVSVVICKPNTNGLGNCVTVNNILLDTGSSGLRVFRSKVANVPLTQVMNGSGDELAKCTNYADGTNQWGPVKTADLVLGGEVVSNVNIQIIDDTYATVPTACQTAEVDGPDVSYNGILGVGIRDHDCGASCVSYANPANPTPNKLYFGCTGPSGTCTDSLAALATQVRNPVAAMTAASNTDGQDDSKGSILVLPDIPSTGSLSASGYLVFGIGSRANNTPTVSTKVLSTDSNGYFVTNFNGQNLNAFIDSGSNGLFFPSSSSTPTCYGGWFCPSSTVSLQAIHKPYLGGTQYNVTFEVINASSVFKSNNYALKNLGASASGVFDWGLPFFYGRSVYTGISGKGAVINGTTAPFYAY